MLIVKKIKDFVRKYFITGLLVVVPVAATVYILKGIMGWIDSMLGDLPSQFLGLKFPGLGIITLLLLILAVGMFSANYFGTRLVRFWDRMMQRVPLVRGVYSTVKQIMETFSMQHNFHGVGIVEYPRHGCYSMGFITGAVDGRVIGKSGKFLTVFVPTTPNPTAGFLLILPEQEVIQIDLSVEQGMKFIISIGLVPFHDVHALKAAAEEASR
jgi:uncharacterized membrane protein